MNLFPLLCLALHAQGGIPADTVVPAPPAPSQVLATVNGAAIRASDVEAYLWDWRGSEVLQDIITGRLIQAEATRVGVTVSEAEVAKEYESQLTQMKASLQPTQNLDDALRQRGFTKSRLYLRERTELLMTHIAEKEFSPADFVSVSTMLFKPKSESASDLADAIQRADAVRARLIKGEKWEDVMKSAQQDPQLVQANGLLGWRPISVFPEITKPELKTIKVGEITKSVQTKAGIQIFRLDGKGDTAPADQMTQLKSQFVQMEKAGILQRLRSNAKIEKVFGGKD